jgi:hypothetical protein
MVRQVTRKQSELFDFAAQVIHETDRAWLLSDGRTTAWVPKSVCQDNQDGTFTLPASIAEEKGFA